MSSRPDPMRRRTLLAAAAASTLVAACGGGADRTMARVRLVNASSAYALLDLLADGDRVIESVGYGASASYEELDPDDDPFEITRPGATTALLSLDPSLREDRDYTLLAYGGEGALAAVLLDDDEDAPDSGRTLVRVVNAAPDAGSLDVFLTAAGESLAAATPLSAAAAVGKASEFASVTSGQLQLRVTGAGNRDDLRLDQADLTFASRKVMTIVITPSVGGLLVNALLMEQKGPITAVAGNFARVRLAAPNVGVVTATVAGQPIGEDLDAPAIGEYVRVLAGTKPVSLVVGGAEVPVPDVTLAPGTDQTLLISKDAGGISAVWLLDDNRRPTTSGHARLRFVHGLASMPESLSLKVNLSAVANAVLRGTASAYTSLAASTTARLSVNPPGGGAPLYEATDQTLLAGGVYSVFVVDGSSAETRGFLKQDR